MKLRCRCIDGHLTLPVRERYEPQDSDVICGALANPTLHRTLHNMPRLSTVIVCPAASHAFGHGLLWETLCDLLSLPHLTRLVLDWVRMCPRPPDPSALQPQPSTTLSCLQYLLPNIRYQYSQSSEVKAVDRQLDIARSLASLADLQILKIHLDFPEMPWPMPDRRSGITHYWTLENPEDFEQRLRAATATFVKVLKPCLKQVWHFHTSASSFTGAYTMSTVSRSMD